MEAVGEHLAPTAEEPIDGASDANGEPLNAAAQGCPIHGLEDEVQVVVLDGIVDEAEPKPVGAGPKGRSYREEALPNPEPPHSTRDRQSDVHRMSTVELGTAQV